MAIRAKLVIVFCTFIIVPMFLLWARWRDTAVGSIKAVLRQALSDRAEEISNQITRHLQTQQTQILALMGQPALKAYARLATQGAQVVPDAGLRIDLATFVLAHQPLYAALIGVNRQGNPHFKIEARKDEAGITRPFLVDKNFSSEDVVRVPDNFAAAPADHIFVSELQSDGAGKAQINLIAPLRDETNTMTAALVVKLHAEQLLTEAVGPPSASATATRLDIVILSPQDTVLYAADASKQWRPYGEVFRGFEQPIGELRRAAKADLDWQPWLLRHRFRAESPQLSILLLENYSNAVGQLKFDSYLLLLLTILPMIVAMLLLYYLISGITDSVRRVIKGTQAVASGNLNYQIEVKAKDETRVLAETFNLMAARLREMMRKEGEQKQFESFARLSAVLTHDLKNQILSLSLLVSNIERKFHRDDFREDAMRTLSDSVNNLQNLVAKLSDPRTPTGRIREKSNLTHLVERVLQRTAGQAINKYKISAQLTPELYVTVDGKAIERVIENLVINALEAMPDGGSLRAVTKADNGHVIVAIADTGKGMTEEFLRERLFHPFATTKKKGIGLSLYSCRDIIEQHGGRLDVASRVDVGTEFKIVLPLHIEEAKPVATQATTV